MYRQKRKRTDYKICEFCGCALDVGEICDCRKSKPSKDSKPGKLAYIIKRPEIKGGIAV